MKIFVSWSGSASRELALALAMWMPKVIQGVIPFVSAKDIDKGANWTVELARELADSDFGIVCLTPDNLLSPWLNYEAGAITTSVHSRVCPVLLGVSKSDVKAPLSQLQLTSVDVDEFILLMGSVNKAAGSPLDAAAVDEAVRVWWPWLAEKVSSIDVPSGQGGAPVSPEPPKPESSVNEFLEEILGRIRRIESNQRREARGSVRAPRSTVDRIVEGGAPRDSVDQLIQIALASGLDPLLGHTRENAYELVVSKLPAPVPPAAYEDYGKWARESGRDLILHEEGGREVRFDGTGYADEPPF